MEHVDNSLREDACSSNQSIVAGLGFSSEFDLSLEPFSIKEPTVTSTTYALKSRDHVMDKLLEQSENMILKSFRVPASDFNANVDDFVKNISPPKTFQERLLAAKKHLPMKTTETCKPHEINTSCWSTSSFINVNDMSNLSTSSFLMKTLENKSKNDGDYLEHGLPSILISGSKSNTHQNKVGSSGVDPWESSDGISHSKENHFIYQPDECDDDLLEKEIEDGVNQLSARSFCFQKSNLLSSSCNSLGSFGKAENEDCSFSSVSLLGEQSLDSFLCNQQNLAEFVNEDEFKDIDINALEKDEEEFKKDNVFNKDYTFYSEHSNAADLSGFHCSSQNITVRASWLSSLKCDDLKPGDKINIEQLFKAKSCNMGSLEDENAEKPSFGLGNTVSPPKEIPEDGICFNTIDNEEGSFSKRNQALVNFIQRESGDGSEEIDDRTSFPKSDFNNVLPGELAQSLGDLHSSVGTEQFKKILLDASTADDPAKMITKVLKVIKDGAIINVSDESSMVDTSFEVLELRKIKENRFRQLYGNVRANMNLNDKENIDYDNIEYKFAKDTTCKKNNSTISKIDAISDNLQGVHISHFNEKVAAATQLNCIPMLQENQSQNIVNNNRSKPTSISSPKRPTRFRMGTSSLRTNNQSASADCNLQAMTGNKSNCTKPVVVNGYSQVPTPVNINSESSVGPRNHYFSDSDTIRPNNFTKDCSDHQLNIPSEVYFSNPCITNIRSETSINIDNSSNSFLQVSATELKVDVECDGSSTIDFGLVAESCLVRKEVTIINRSNSSFPVILNLQNELETTTEVLYWSESNGLKLITPTLAACELVPSNKSVLVTVMFKAPCLDNFAGKHKCLLFTVTCKLLIAIDSPYGSPMIIKETPIMVQVGEVRIRTIKNEIPFILKTSANEIVTKEFCLKNESSFPLTIKAGIPDSSKGFSVSPTISVIKPEAKSVIKISFNPFKIEDENEIERLLRIGIEPEGMEFEVPLKGIVTMVTTLPNKLNMDSLTKSVKENSKPLNHLLNHQDKNKQCKFQKPNQPMQNKINRELSLECSKSRVAFGTVRVSCVQSQNLILYNTWPDEKLVLNVAFVGCKDYEFTMSDSENNEKSKSRELVIDPNGEANLTIYFEPSEICSYSASLVCKPKGLAKQVKITLPIQGFGGSGNLTFGKSEKITAISLGEISPGNPTVGNTIVRNTGDRAIFVKLLALFDDSSEAVISSSDIKILPPDFILNPGESRDILLVALGTPFLIAKAPGKVAVFQAIFGDEILRNRFRRMKSRKIRNTKIKDLTLLNTNWDTYFVNETEVLEKDDLPLQADDCLLFLNGCRKKKISIHAEIDPESEVSSSLYSIVPQEETFTSFIQTHLEENNLALGNRLTTSEIKIKNAVGNTKQEFSSFPNDLKLTLQSPEQNVTVVNYSNKDQPIEAVCEDSWLLVEPPEAMLYVSKFYLFVVKIQTSKLPIPLPRLLKTSVEILGENCRSIVHVTLDLNDDHLPSVGLTVPANHCRNAPNRSSSNSISNSRKVMNTSEKSCHNGHSLQKVELTSQEKGDVSCDISTESRVELVTNELEFPTIKAKSKDALKLTLRNYDKVPHKINAVIQSEQFIIRHTSFEIKPGFHINLPVYFVPQCRGNFSAQLVLTVIEDRKVLFAKLYGKAI